MVSNEIYVYKKYNCKTVTVNVTEFFFIYLKKEFECKPRNLLCERKYTERCDLFCRVRTGFLMKHLLNVEDKRNIKNGKM